MSDDKYRSVSDYSDDEWEELLKRVKEKAEKEAKQLKRSYQLMIVKLLPYVKTSEEEQTDEKENPFKRYANVIRVSPKKTHEKIKLIFLIAIQSQQPGKSLTAADILDKLHFLSAREIDEMLDLESFFREYVKSAWDVNATGKLEPYDENLPLYARLKGMAPETIYNYYSNEKVKEVLLNLYKKIE